MTSPTFHHLLTELRTLHAAEPDLHGFCPLPPNLAEQPVTPHPHPASDLMLADADLHSPPAFTPLRDAFLAAAPHAQWRETYKGTRLGDDFLSRFGCYCLIGGGGPYAAPDMGAFVVYMPAGLHYPFHHHPAEELYFILAGQAEFHQHGAPTKTARPGTAIFHRSNAPHATDTHDHPFMALVLWRGDLGTKPVLTDTGGTR